MKKFTLVLSAFAVALAVLLAVQGCSKKTTAEPEMPTATVPTNTITPTATQSMDVSPTASPTVSETATASETNTPSLTVTDTATATPTTSVYLIDNFESGVDNWTAAADGGALSNVHSGITAPSSPSYGAYALAVTGEAWAEIGSLPYAGFSSVEKDFTPVDLSAYTSFEFAIAENITFVPYYGGPVKYTVKIKSGSNLIIAFKTSLPSVMTNESIPLSSFVLPAGASGYTAAQVLAAVDGIILEVSISSSFFNDWIGYVIYLDDVQFAK